MSWPTCVTLSVLTVSICAMVCFMMWCATKSVEKSSCDDVSEQDEEDEEDETSDKEGRQ